MPEKFRVQLAGNETDLKFAAMCLPSGEPRISLSEGKYFLETAQLDGVDDPSQTTEAAESVLRIINSSLRLMDANQGPLQVGALERSNNQGGRDVFVSVSATLHIQARMFATMTAIRSDGMVVPPAISTAQKACALAMIDPAVKRGVRYWSDFQHSGDSLYKIYETIRSDVSGDAGIVSHRWADMGRIKEFTSSVNNPQVLGDYARHAKQQGMPSRTMTKEMAETFARELLTKWVMWKHEEALRSGQLT